MTVVLEVVAHTQILDRLALQMPELPGIVAELVSGEIMGAAIDMAPVLTGELRDSISREVDGGDFVVGAYTKYAGAQEFGTSRHGAQPYLIPAVMQVDIDRQSRIALRMIGL